MRVGVISDTHGLLRPEAERALEGVTQIVHAGDIGRPEIIAKLRRIAPVIAIRGNIDTAQWAQCYPETKLVTLGGRSIYVLHDLHALRLDSLSCGVDIVISGHSHRPQVETTQGVLYLNPGSAGPRRFSLPVTLAILELTGKTVQAFIHDIGAAAR